MSNYTFMWFYNINEDIIVRKKNKKQEISFWNSKISDLSHVFTQKKLQILSSTLKILGGGNETL